MTEKGNPSLRRRLPLRRPLLIAGVGALLCLAAWLAAGIYVYWNDPKLVNFMAAWIPFALTVLIAFVPDQNMSSMKRYIWRTSVIAAGFFFSVVLWHQQVITEEVEASSQAKIVAEANKHSDAQFGRVESDLELAKADLGSRIDKVPAQISRTESDLTASISKVGTAPVKYAFLQFSAYSNDVAKLPITAQTLQGDADGIFTLDFTVTNISDTAANAGELWVQVCDECSFAEEPAGFDRPKGMDEHIRHTQFQSLNPGVSLEKMTIRFRVVGRFRSSDVRFRYSCASCGKLPPSQDIRNYLLWTRPVVNAN